MRIRSLMRLEVAVAVLGVVLLALLGVAQNAAWMDENLDIQPKTAVGMVVQHPLSVAKPVERRATVLYTPTDETIPNPERGFYRYIETRSSAPVNYDADLLASYFEDGIRLLYCIHYLDTFVNRPISAPFLAHVQDNLNVVRNARLKCILRFAYTDDDPTQRGDTPPFGDADKERIEAHISQLTPLLRSNADVIAFVQAGFIGVWGEWYYTDHFVDAPETPWVVSPAQYAQRLDVLTALLNAVPVTRTVAIRYPFAKPAMFGDVVTGGQAANAARTGFHNDCFLASDTDFGTYRTDQLDADKVYLAEQTRTVPMGGESCNPNPPRSQCATALAELERFHWSYLNREFNEEVLAGWQAEGCLAEIEQRLGYRLVLKRGLYPVSTQPGAALSISIDLENEGFAAPVNPRPIELVLRHTTNGDIYTLGINSDLRQWLPGVLLRIDETVTIPANLPLGDYELAMYIPDADSTLARNPGYAVRFANADTWDSEHGVNRLLHTLRVEEAVSGEIYLPSVEK